MNTKHTATPWIKVSKTMVLAGDTRRVIVAVGLNDSESESNLERIVSCVNACEGISTEELTKVGFRGLVVPLIESQRPKTEKRSEGYRACVEALKKAQDHIKWHARTVHEAHHFDVDRGDNLWVDCLWSTCTSALLESTIITDALSLAKKES